MLFDKIFRRNDITHRLTAPASPNQKGKVERFHGTLRPDFLDTAPIFTSVAQAQGFVDQWVAEYNTDRPHQGLDVKAPVVPADRFAPVPEERRELLELWLPPNLAVQCSEATAAAPGPIVGAAVNRPLSSTPWRNGPVEFDRAVSAAVRAATGTSLVRTSSITIRKNWSVRAGTCRGLENILLAFVG